ncbi:MAG: GTPase ObgE [Planctomycetota bacterium]
MFVDRAEIIVRGGKGGDGCVSFRREKYVPRGGPDGGDGGRGGDVIIKATPQLGTLMDLSSRREYAGGDGRPGAGKTRTGKSGEDVTILVPVGTLVMDLDSGRTLRDLAKEGLSIIAARGGKGGKGNARFATSINRAPRTAEPGEEGEERRIRLDLKLIADVGIIGLPNAGKSTLLARLSSARPKIASYPFTTLEPQLGIVEAGDFERFVMADIPGLIEGAHEGAGLGSEFLRHIERTRFLLHLVDIAPTHGPTSFAAYQSVRDELRQYSVALAAKPQMIVANKMDLSGAAENLDEFTRQVGAEVHAISAVTGQGLPDLVRTILHQLRGLDSEAEHE